MGMSLCSFLSSGESKISCFNDCVFYNWEENTGVCPFKNVTGNRFSKVKDLFSYDMFEEDTVSIKGIDQYYKEKEYI
jgi:hypothetical protein